MESTRLFAPALPAGWPKHVRSAILHVISLAHVALTTAHGHAVHNRNALIRAKAENRHLRRENALLSEEMRIKDSRMMRVAAHQRPHYTPVNRMAILELRASRGWSLVQTAMRLLVSTATVASWMHRLNDDGPAAIVQTREPVNKYPNFVAYIVQRLKILSPTLGYRKMAQFLCRAGLHLSATTIRRMQRQDDSKRPLPTTAPEDKTTVKRVTAKCPNDVWQCDLTTVPIALGLWVPWLPHALTQCWPFCWWVAVAVDHYSRRILGFAIYKQQPTSQAVRALLRRVMRSVGCNPRYLVTDQGMQFTDAAFRVWTRRLGIRQRFGALGQHGSIALIERLMRTIKQECTRRLLVPYAKRPLVADLALFSTWYNKQRPHEALSVATPDEIYFDVAPACMQPRFEPRPHWPRTSPCAGPQAKVRGKPGARLELHVDYVGGRRHLPIVALERVA